MARNRFNFDTVFVRLQRLKSDIPVVISNQTKNFFVDSFRKQGWTDSSLKKWDKRNPDTRPGGAILIKSGALRRSIKIRRSNFSKILIGSYLPYSKVHNEGFKGSVSVKSYSTRTGRQVRSHARQMNTPKRQFMGNSRKLMQIHEKTILKAIDKAFRQ